MALFLRVPTLILSTVTTCLRRPPSECTLHLQRIEHSRSGRRKINFCSDSLSDSLSALMSLDLCADLSSMPWYKGWQKETKAGVVKGKASYQSSSSPQSLPLKCKI